MQCLDASYFLSIHTLLVHVISRQCISFGLDNLNTTVNVTTQYSPPPLSDLNSVVIYRARSTQSFSSYIMYIFNKYQLK
jgi:hypothetical protein